MGTGDGKSLAWWKRTALYRLYDANDTLIYVGIAFNPSSRYTSHKKTKTWWPEVKRREVTWYDSRTEAAAAEIEAIRSELPLYNRNGFEPVEAAPALAADGIQEVPATIARPLMSRLIQQAREDGVVSALTAHGRRKVYIVTPEFYERAIAALAKQQS